MENRIALIGIIVENPDVAEKLNGILHLYREYIIGRMGLPYARRQISIISVAVDAQGDIINALSGKLGALKGVTTKTVYSSVS
ncbi:MAG: iron-only hydrogenase system regulator [Bacillota bacterium]|nr:iron-only hydrogenase system regulator [Bacillota bacterium]